MINIILLSIGACVVALWGIAHIVIPTKDIVASFGKISRDNKLTLVMEWIAEGFTLCFIGVIVILVTIVGGVEDTVSIAVYRASAVMLIAMAVLSLFTGARTSILPMKLCPPIFTGVAVLFFLGSVL